MGKFDSLGTLKQKIRLTLKLKIFIRVHPCKKNGNRRMTEEE
jgi:hypothetical protein